MTMALKWGRDDPDNEGMIYFDVITAYSESHTGKVTQHPVDTGGNITDHFIKDNSKYVLSAVISSIDISNQTYLITDGENNYPFNSSAPVTSVAVGSTDNSVLSKFIPDSLGQFLSDSTPEITMDSERTDLLDQIKFLLVDLMSGVKLNPQTNQFDSNVQIVELFQYEGTFITDIIQNLVMTNITFEERPETGRGLYCNITLEQISFVSLQKTEIPVTVQPQLKNKVSKKKVQTKCDGTVKDSENPPQGEASPNGQATDIDPLRGAADND